MTLGFQARQPGSSRASRLGMFEQPRACAGLFPIWELKCRAFPIFRGVGQRAFENQSPASSPLGTAYKIPGAGQGTVRYSETRS
jgi:hypothetical protein